MVSSIWRCIFRINQLSMVCSCSVLTESNWTSTGLTPFSRPGLKDGAAVRWLQMPLDMFLSVICYLILLLAQAEVLLKSASPTKTGYAAYVWVRRSIPMHVDDLCTQTFLRCCLLKFDLMFWKELRYPLCFVPIYRRCSHTRPKNCRMGSWIFGWWLIPSLSLGHWLFSLLSHTTAS